MLSMIHMRCVRDVWRHLRHPENCSLLPEAVLSHVYASLLTDVSLGHCRIEGKVFQGVSRGDS